MEMIDKLIKRIRETKNPSVIGLDTRIDFLPDNLRQNVKSLSDAGKAILEFNKAIVDQIKDIVPAVKVQIACYEALGIAGMKAFAGTVKYARKSGMVVIADAKRNDIGSTAEDYSTAFLGKHSLGKSEFSSDFLTVNGYLGFDGIKPFAEDCKKNKKGIFVLVKTSNPSGVELQNKTLADGKKVYEQMAELVNAWGADTIGKYGYSNVGAVVGATYPEEAERLRKAFPSMFFLVPGYGAQGGTAADAAVNFDANGLGAIVNSSRAILTAYKKDKYKGLSFDQAAREAAFEMKEDLGKFVRVF